MKKTETIHCEDLYQRHLKLLKLQGKADKTIESYSRAILKLSKHFDCCPGELIPEQLQDYFYQLVQTHSWSTVKVDRLGIQFYWRHILKKDWQWLDIVKPPKVYTIPDILNISEIENLISSTQKLRYQVFLLTTYSMGLRLSEALNLQVGDIDAQRHQIHIRRGKGHKDRMMPLPDLTLKSLRTLWATHRHPTWLFPNPVGSFEQVKNTTTHMDRGGTQNAMKAVIKTCHIKKKSPYIHCVIVGQHIYLSVA